MECGGDSSLDIVVAVETHQAGFRMEAPVGKRRHADLDRFRDRLRIPWAGDPVRVETDDKDMKPITH